MNIAPVTQIKRDFVRDHSSYLKSYATHMKTEVPADCIAGIRKYKTYRELLSELTVRYPRVMAYMMNPIEANRIGITQSIIQNEMVSQVGGMSGGDPTRLEAMQSRINEIKKIIAGVSGVDLKGVQSVAEQIMGEIGKLESELEGVKDLKSNVINPALNPDTVLSNLHTTLTTLESKGRTMEQRTILADVSVPVRGFDKFEEVETLPHIIQELTISYLKIFEFDDISTNKIGRILTSIIEGKSLEDIVDSLRHIDESEHTPIVNNVLEIAVKLVIDKPPLPEYKSEFIRLFSSLIKGDEVEIGGKKFKMDGLITKIDDVLYLDMIREYSEKIMQNLEVYAKLDEAAVFLRENTTSLKNFASGQDRVSYGAIRAYLLPRISNTIATLRAARIKETFEDHYASIDSIIKYFDDNLNDLEDDPIASDDHNKFRDGVISIYSAMNSLGSSGEAPIGAELQKLYTHIDQYDYKKVLDRIQEKFRGSDSAKVNEFLRHYNQIMTPELARELNILVANDIQSNHSALSERYNIIEKDQMVAESLKKLITKKMRGQVKESKFTIPAQIAIDTLQTYFVQTEHSPEKTDHHDVTTYEDARKYIDVHNKNYSKLSHSERFNHRSVSQIRLIPTEYFITEYTERIINQVFKKVDSSTGRRIELLSAIFGIETETEGADVLSSVKSIYRPDFEQLKKTMGTQLGGDVLDRDELEPKLKAMDQGGLQDDIKISNISECLTILSELVTRINTVNAEYNALVADYSIQYNHIYSYLRFLILIATNQFFTENYVIYKYINKGTIEFYRRVMSKMLCDLERGSSEPHIARVRKYYHTVVYRLAGFLNEASRFLQKSTDILDIRSVDETAPELRNSLILLNYFKPILESYNEMFQNQITIYARLNDIKTEINYDDKIFVSDLEYQENRRKLGPIGEGAKDAEVETKADTGTMVEEEEEEEEEGEEKPEPEPELEKDIGCGTGVKGADTSKMYTRVSKCGDIARGAEDLQDIQTKFTEVFDSINFPENSDISKYMTLETQLAKKKGVCIMTYGYSGTGKTYTLFGNKDREGVLKSTLVNINGLEKVEFRLFELYGRGLPYHFYWNEKEGGKSRMEDIYHRIFHYNLRATNERILVEGAMSGEDISEIMPKDFRDFIESDNTYVSIDKELIGEVFGNFSDFTEQIDLYRKNLQKTEGGITKLNIIPGKSYRNIQRIRETPNNPESSRSILVYDFNLFVGSEDSRDSVRFMIIDLPGREEISQTYIDPYLENAHIQNMIKSGIEDIPTSSSNDPNDRIDLIKMIITSMALNPMALGVFDCKAVLDAYNEGYESTTVSKLEMSNRVLLNEINKAGILDRDRLPRKDKSTGEIEKARLSRVFKNESGIIVKKCFKNIFGFNTERQYYGLASIFIMAELVMSADFENIERIYQKIIDYHINGPIKRSMDGMTAENTYDLMVGLLETKFKGTKGLDTVKDIVSDLNPKSEADEGRTTESEAELQANLVTFLQTASARNRIIDALRAKDNTKLLEAKAKLIALLKYDYLITPFEGIYINENIVGLIDFLSNKLIRSEETIDFVKEQEEVQVENLRDITRIWLMSNELNYSTPSGSTDPTYRAGVIKRLKLKDSQMRVKPKREDTQYMSLFESVDQLNPYISCGEEVQREIGTAESGSHLIDLRMERVNLQQRIMTQDYEADRIFNKKKPLIQDILEPYIPIQSDRIDESRRESNIKKIKDYKIFYLFGNYDDDEKSQFKCEHQIKLLGNTEDFIKAVI